MLCSSFSKYRTQSQWNKCLKIYEDFKSVYRSENREIGVKALEDIVKKWKLAYPKVTKSLMENQYILTFYSFPKSIWRSIYSTNFIESVNKQTKKYSNRKKRFLVSQSEIYYQKFSTGCHLGFRANIRKVFHYLRELLEYTIPYNLC